MEKELSFLLAKLQGIAQTDKKYGKDIFNQEGKLLLVKEKSDNRWSLPGGWADIGYSPKEIAEKETMEEAGISVRAKRLISVLDRSKHEFPPALTYVYKFFIRCVAENQELKTGI